MNLCPRVIGLAGCLLLCAMPGLAQASGDGSAAVPAETPHTSRYSVEAALKYDTNLDLVVSRARRPGHDDLATELALRGQTWRRFARKWSLGLHGSILGDLYRERTTEDWLYGRGSLTAIRRLSAGVVELSDQIRYYSKPRHDEFDFVRNVAMLAYRHSMSERWQVGGGFDNVVTRYPNASRFDYTITGANVEVRTRWSENASAYGQLDFQFYTGTATPRDPDPRSSPDKGTRWTTRLGLDWLLAGSQSLSLTCEWRLDRAELGINQIGEYEGHEESQDSEAEFDLNKQRATALYTLPLSPRIVFSSYLEFINKHFDNDADAVLVSIPGSPALGGLTDRLLLSSTHLKVGITDHLSARLRYLFRTNDSSQSSRAYTDHIVSLGMIYRN